MKFEKIIENAHPPLAAETGSAVRGRLDEALKHLARIHDQAQLRGAALHWVELAMIEIGNAEELLPNTKVSSGAKTP